jgi:hypothetical protein
LYGAFVWAHRALNSRKRRFPARAEGKISAAEKGAAEKGRMLRRAATLKAEVLPPQPSKVGLRPGRRRQRHHAASTGGWRHCQCEVAAAAAPRLNPLKCVLVHVSQLAVQLVHRCMEAGCLSKHHHPCAVTSIARRPLTARRESASEKGVRLAQKVQVGPCLPVGIQL